ncbi:hypothetical protein [Adlercreutzia aquisgranensis]|uniref:hypothetical protein n=1 Tax=Adlercreutzia aquisgranensis TaxID=2941323 RepID=UPI00203E206C|nr:hypothetical protein [Adlercreutzia aquisgranensis]
MFVAELLEAGMLVCFGLSWPMNAWKAYKAGTAQGSSWQFLALICAGYACGIAAKLTLGTLNWVLAVYLLNCVFLAANWAVYFRNRRLDALREVPEGTHAAQDTPSCALSASAARPAA